MKKLIFAFLALFLFACNNASYSGEKSANYEQPRMTDMSAPQAAEMESDGATESGYDGNAKIPAPEKKIIKTANLQLEVKKLKTARDSVGVIIKKYEAEIANETQTNAYYRLENTLTLRVKPDNFEPLIKSLENLAINVQNKNISAEDVTKQFVDLETRLQTKRDVIARYRDILKSAKTIKDILEVEEKLRVVVEEVESIEAQLKYLRDQTQMSTVSVTLFETLDNATSADKRSFLDRLGKSLAFGWEVFIEILLGIARIWPIALIFTAFVWWLVRKIRRDRAAKK